MTRLLELEDVEARYGPVHALHGISLAVEEGSVVAVLGPNGAGKTTTLRAISGTVRRSGRIQFAGRPLTRLGPDGVARLGIAHVPEGRGTFSELTVWENLRLGAYTRRGSVQPELERVFTAGCFAHHLHVCHGREQRMHSRAHECFGQLVRFLRGTAVDR